VRYQFRLERSNEYRIKQTIKRHYDHTTRPVRNDKTAVNVLVAISLYHILDTVSIPLLCGSNCLALCDIALWTVASLPALGPWAPPAERGPSLESIYRVSLTVDLCECNKIISLKNYFTTASWGPLKKKKTPGPWAHAQCAH